MLYYRTLFSLYPNEGPLNAVNILVFNELTRIKRTASDYLNLVPDPEAPLCDVVRLL